MTRISNSVNKSSSPATIKFLYSYGGKILPRKTDGKLRYVGGYTRVLAADRSISYAELIVKFFEACGFSVNLKCKLPSEDLDVLVSVTSDEDLTAVVEEYDRVSPESKIRAVLVPVSSLKTISPVPSVESLVDYSASKRLSYRRRSDDHRNMLAGRCHEIPVLPDRKSLLLHDLNSQWLLNKNRLGGR